MYFLLKLEIPTLDFDSNDSESLSIISAHMSLEDAQEALINFAIHFWGFDDVHDIEYEGRETIYGTLSEDYMVFHMRDCEDEDLLDKACEDYMDVTVQVVEFGL